MFGVQGVEVDIYHRRLVAAELEFEDDRVLFVLEVGIFVVYLKQFLFCN